MATNSKSLQPVFYLAERAAHSPDNLLFDSGEYQVTNSEAFEFVRKAANFLSIIGIKRGDVVALNLPAPLHILFMLATWHEAAISAAYSNVIDKQIGWRPEFILSTNEYSPDSAQTVIRVDEVLIDHIESLSPARTPKLYFSEDDYVRILFSSGTTGAPKGVPFSLKVLERRSIVRREYWLNQGKFMSLFDIGALGGFGTFHGQFISGETYLVPGEAGHNAKLIRKHSVEFLQGSPSQVSTLTEIAEKHAYQIDSIKTITVAGAQISPFLAQRASKILKAQIFNLYGSTEGGVISIRSDSSTDPTDLGQVIPHVRVEIVNEQDESLEIDTIGKIRIKSSEGVTEYYRDGDATRNFFKDGWFYPGDLGRLTKEGRLFLEGRNEELINIGGSKIDPTRIDNFIIGKLDIVDAGGFSFDSESGIEEFGLAIVVTGHATDSEILEVLKSEFGLYAPKSIHRVPVIPRNERGKVLRHNLASRSFN